MAKVEFALCVSILIIGIFISHASGLTITASTGGNGCSSSTTVSYGSTVEDYVNQHAKLNPDEGTLSNAFSGSGNLPSGSIGIIDGKGNYARVSRMASGAGVNTKWNYDWNTYRPYSSTAGYGVEAWLSLKVSNAYSISASGYASNSEGDVASASTTIGTTYPYITSSLSNYYTNAYAYTNNAHVDQSASNARSTGPITIAGYSDNAEKDHAAVSMYASAGSINSPNMYADATKTRASASPAFSNIDARGFLYTGILHGDASNKEGDFASFDLTVTNGQIMQPGFFAWSGAGYADTFLISLQKAYGSSAEIKSQGKNRALGYENLVTWNPNKLNTRTGKPGDWDRTLLPVNAGEGDFVAKKINNDPFINVLLATGSTKQDIRITPIGFGTKTALILDPRRWEFEDCSYNRQIWTDANGIRYQYVTGIDIRDPLLTYFKNAGYAVTYYSDAAVSKEKVGQMDNYWVSVINTHATSTGLDLSKSSNGLTYDVVTASELKNDGKTNKGSWDTSNGMIILTICNTFTNTGTGTLADAASKAMARGGFSSITGIDFSRKFLNNYFYYMSRGSSATQANDLAKATDNYDRTKKQLKLRPTNTNFKL